MSSSFFAKSEKSCMSGSGVTLFFSIWRPYKFCTVSEKNEKRSPAYRLFGSLELVVPPNIFFASAERQVVRVWYKVRTSKFSRKCILLEQKSTIFQFACCGRLSCNFTHKMLTSELLGQEAPISYDCHLEKAVGDIIFGFQNY